jgi:hypothetical protein
MAVCVVDITSWSKYHQQILVTKMKFSRNQIIGAVILFLAILLFTLARYALG